MKEGENGTEFFLWEIIDIKCIFRLIDILIDFWDKAQLNLSSKDHLFLVLNKSREKKPTQEKIISEQSKFLPTSTS